MFTLRDLLDQVTMQGDIRISQWHGDDETVFFESRNIDDLCCEDISAFEDKEISYIFTGGDGYMHIELSADADE